MVDNIVTSSGNLIESAVAVRRTILHDGVSHDSARRVLMDVAFATDILKDAAAAIKGITEAFSGGRDVPTVKAEQAAKDLDGVIQGLEVVSERASAASQALCGDLNYGIPLHQPTQAKQPGKEASGK